MVGLCLKVNWIPECSFFSQYVQLTNDFLGKYFIFKNLFLLSHKTAHSRIIMKYKKDTVKKGFPILFKLFNNEYLHKYVSI